MDNGWGVRFRLGASRGDGRPADRRCRGERTFPSSSPSPPRNPTRRPGPFDAAAARDRLNAAAPRPVPVDRVAAAERIAAARRRPAFGAGLALLTDGLASNEDEAVWESLCRCRHRAPDSGPSPEQPSMLALTGGGQSGRRLCRHRHPPGKPTRAPRQVTAGAYDDRGRRLADAVLGIRASGESEARGEIRVPFELRNTISPR